MKRTRVEPLSPPAEDIDHQADKVVAAGANGVFQKPVNALALLDALEQDLRKVLRVA